MVIACVYISCAQVRFTAHLVACANELACVRFQVVLLLADVIRAGRCSVVGAVHGAALLVAVANRRRGTVYQSSDRAVPVGTVAVAAAKHVAAPRGGIACIAGHAAGDCLRVIRRGVTEERAVLAVLAVDAVGAVRAAAAPRRDVRVVRDDAAALRDVEDAVSRAGAAVGVKDGRRDVACWRPCASGVNN